MHTWRSPAIASSVRGLAPTTGRHSDAPAPSRAMAATTSTSATFERALRYRSTFDARRGDPVAWLIGIARRELAAHFSGDRADLELLDVVAPGDLALESARRLDLRAAIERLDDRDRELIAL